MPTTEDLDELGWPLPEEPAGYDDPLPPPEDADQANRRLRTMTYLRRRINEDVATAEADIARTRAWLTAKQATFQQAYDWLEASVAGWARAVHRADPKRKTISLPFGEVPIRPRQPRLEVALDQAGLAVLAKSHPGWVRAGKLEPAKDAMKAGTVAGRPLDPQPGKVPEGYQACEALIPGDVATGVEPEPVPGAVWLVPLDGVDGKTVTVNPDVA